MLLRLLLQILDWLCGGFCLMLLARFIMQWARASFRNQIGQFVIAITDWLVLPARRLLPGLLNVRGLDLPSLLLAWLTQAMYVGLVVGLSGKIGMAGAFVPATFGLVALLSAIEVFRLAIYLVMGVVIVSALLSWVNPYAPLAPVFNAVAAPFLRPLQRLIPLLGGVDLSPLALLLALQLLLGLLIVFQHAFSPVFIH